MLICPDCGSTKLDLYQIDPRMIEPASPDDEDVYRCLGCGAVGEERDLIIEEETE